VPDEFAEAYRAAYAEAMRAQPERRPTVEPAPEGAAPSRLGGMPPWLVPALAVLVLLVVILVAYTVLRG
jgi:hypothetical protein